MARPIVKFKEFVKTVIPYKPAIIRALSYPIFRKWTTEKADKCPKFQNRYKLYDHIENEYIGNKAFDYLEFGVYKGASIDYWTKINRDEETRFYGFDTFTGLPEAWKEGQSVSRPQGSFSSLGVLPNIKDPRVHFIRGLFQDTLDKFLRNYKPGGKLVIHNDSDLYTSSLYLLTKCDNIITPGTIIIFDELSSWMNEFKALEDYVSSYYRNYEVIASTSSFTEVAIIFT